MHELILIEKDSPASIWWKNLVSSNRISELSTEEIVNRYKGFEGDLIFMFNLEEKKYDRDEIIKQCVELQTLGNCLLLHVISHSMISDFFLNEVALQVGYDVGVCEEEKTIYSSIYNEILFGHLDELIFYKNLLNENFLFQDRSLAEEYVSLHNKLSEQGKGVEDYELMTIYEIWEHRDPKIPREVLG